MVLIQPQAGSRFIAGAPLRGGAAHRWREARRVRAVVARRRVEGECIVTIGLEMGLG